MYSINYCAYIATKLHDLLSKTTVSVTNGTSLLYEIIKIFTLLLQIDNWAMEILLLINNSKMFQD